MAVRPARQPHLRFVNRSAKDGSVAYGQYLGALLNARMQLREP